MKKNRHSKYTNQDSNSGIKTRDRKHLKSTRRSCHNMAAHNPRRMCSLGWGLSQCQLPLKHVNLQLLFKKPISLGQCQAFYSVLRTDGTAEDRRGHSPCSFTGRNDALWPHGKMGSVLLPCERAAEACAQGMDLH